MKPNAVMSSCSSGIPMCRSLSQSSSPIPVILSLLFIMTETHAPPIDYESLQRAVFDCYFDVERSSLTDAAAEHDVSINRIRRAMKAWIFTDAQPQTWKDIQFDLPSVGRPTKLGQQHESTIAEAVRYYAENKTPLSKQGIRALVEHYISLLPLREQERIGFKYNMPSVRWVKNFADRNHLAYRKVQQVEAARINAVTEEHICEHIARVQAAIKRYGIRSASQIVNMDQSGMSFKKMVGRSLRKGFVSNNKGNKSSALQKTLSAKGNLDRVTIMPVVSACGKAFKPVVVYPGKLPHYRKVNGRFETLSDVLMPSYLYHNDTSAANSEIIYDWGMKFIEETKELRSNGDHMILILDGYGAHIQFPFLQMMKENRIVVIALPSHTSHVLQPLDLTVFAAYKSFLEEELHRTARIASKLNAFTVGSCISNAYAKAFVSPIIRSGFVRSGLWNWVTYKTDVSALEHLFGKFGVEKPSLDLLLRSFEKNERSLLREANVEEDGRIRINTSAGANVTSECVLAALKLREDRKKAAQDKEQTDAVEPADVNEGRPALRRYAELAERRIAQRKRLRESRKLRLNTRRTRACLSSST